MAAGIDQEKSMLPELALPMASCLDMSGCPGYGGQGLKGVVAIRRVYSVGTALHPCVGWEKDPWGIVHSFRSDLTATDTVSPALVMTATLEGLRVLAMEVQRMWKNLDLGSLGSQPSLQSCLN